MHGFEHSRELEGVLEAALARDVVHGDGVLEQQQGGVLHPQAGQELVGAPVVEAGDQAAEIWRVELASRGHGFERAELQVVLLKANLKPAIQ